MRFTSPITRSTSIWWILLRRRRLPQAAQKFIFDRLKSHQEISYVLTCLSSKVLARTVKVDAVQNPLASYAKTEWCHHLSFSEYTPNLYQTYKNFTSVPVQRSVWIMRFLKRQGGEYIPFWTRPNRSRPSPVIHNGRKIGARHSNVYNCIEKMSDWTRQANAWTRMDSKQPKKFVRPARKDGASKIPRRTGFAMPRAQSPTRPPRHYIDCERAWKNGQTLRLIPGSGSLSPTGT